MLTYSSRTSRKNKPDGPLKNIDWFTVVIYLMLMAFGVVSIYAAAYDFDHASICLLYTSPSQRD